MMKNSFKTTFRHTLAMLPLIALSLYGQAQAGTSKYEGQSLCNADDEIYEGCVTQSGKTVSICGTTKQKPSIMYLAYGTPDKIEVSSPRTGEFPLKHTHIMPAGSVFYFSENEKQFIAYNVVELRGPFHQAGFVTRNDSNHDILSHDMCRTRMSEPSHPLNSIDYIQREEKSPGHSESIDNHDDNHDTRLSDLMYETAK